MTAEMQKEFDRLIKAASDYAKTMPDRFWMIDDSNRLIHFITDAISIKTGKKSNSITPFSLSIDNKERFVELNGIIENTLKLFPKKLTEDQAAIIHKLNLEKALALKKK